MHIVWIDAHGAAQYRRGALGGRKYHGALCRRERLGRFAIAFASASRIPDRRVYEKWVQYWREEIEKPSLTRGADGRAVDRSAPEFLDALATKSDLSFMLVPGGTLQTEVSAGELQEAISDLYERLVLDADHL